MGRECPHCHKEFRWPLQATVDGWDVDICPSCRVPLDSPPGAGAAPVEGQIAAMATPSDTSGSEPPPSQGPPGAPAPYVPDDFSPTTAMKPTKPGLALPLWDRAKVAAAVVGLVGVVAAISLVVDLSQLDLVNRAISGERVTLMEASASDDRVATMAIIYLVAVILSSITFLLWYSRAYKNTIALGMSKPRYTTGWAVGYWFIPIVSFFRPKQVMNDIWRGSDPDLPQQTGDVSKRDVSPILHWWWAFWLGSTFAANYATRIAFQNDFPTAQDFKNEATAYVIADIADIIAAGLAIAVIIVTTRRQEERRATQAREDALKVSQPTSGIAG